MMWWISRRQRALISLLVSCALWALFVISVWIFPKGDSAAVALWDGVLVLLAIVSTAITLFYLRGILGGR